MIKYDYYVADFETTVYDGQKETEVWASALVKLYTEDVHILHSISDTFDWLLWQNKNIVLYYHNLAFDGSFWLDFLMKNKNYEQAYEVINEEKHEYKFLRDKQMKNGSFKYVISDKGQWYSITIKTHTGKFIQLRDSYKLLPFSVEAIGKNFDTKHKKLQMEYKGFRYAGCNITDEEKEYIKNDVLVIKEALEIMFNEGHTELTIGSCCLKEYKKKFSKTCWEDMFPDLTKFPLDPLIYGEDNADKYIRNSYKGGWCYLVKGKENKVFTNGTTADVNSLYPSMMSSESGNIYPVGKPTFWQGNYIPDEALANSTFFFIRIKTRFYLRKGYLPFIQIKRNLMYKGTECLETSDVFNKKTGQYNEFYIDTKGVLQDTRVVLTLTMTDYRLILEHYELVDFEILDGCYFSAMSGIFDNYIEKYKKMKLTSIGSRKQLAKLFLNNLYGKMATSTNSNFKVAYLKDDNSLGFFPVLAEDKKAVYIPCGSAITSYARNFTIRTAQKNYYGIDKPGFIYADTDSIHCDLTPEQIKGVKVHDKDFCCWKLEGEWDKGIFVRQKTYIEHIVKENQEEIERPYYNVKCAGMPKKCKTLFIHTLEHTMPDDEIYSKLSMDEKEFLKHKRNLSDFRIGLIVPGKLLPKRINGGILLTETTFEIRG